MEAKMIVDALTATEVAPPPLGFAVVVVLVLGEEFTYDVRIWSPRGLLGLMN